MINFAYQKDMFDCLVDGAKYKVIVSPAEEETQPSPKMGWSG